MATALNAAGERGDLDAIKVLAGAIPKAAAPNEEPSQVPPQTTRADQIAQQITSQVATALGGGFTGASLLTAVVAVTPAIATTAVTAAMVVAALVTLGFLETVEHDLTEALELPVEEAFDYGWKLAQKTPIENLPEDALRNGALAQALALLKIELKGVSQTSVDRIGNALADAIVSGEGSGKAAEAIAPILNDQKRAQVIARTEIARAMESALLAQAKAQGGMDKEWLDAPNACPICQANTAEGVIPIDQSFGSGDPNPPAHPNCRCALALIPASVAALN